MSQDHGSVLYQDGLEVVPDNAEKVVVPRNEPKIVMPRQEGLETADDGLYNNTKSTAPPIEAYTEKQTPWWRSRRVIIASILLILAVIVGAAVGGVLGSRPSSRSSESAETEASALSSIAPGSPLAATAIRLASAYFILLGYRDAEANLKVSIRSNTYDTPNATWGNPISPGPRLHNDSNIAISAHTFQNSGLFPQVRTLL
jgi:hypothetical protein